MSFSVQQRQAEGKTAALARLTLQQDLAPVQVRQLLRNGQTEAGGIVLGVGGGVEVAVKHGGLILRRDAAAGVRDLYAGPPVLGSTHTTVTRPPEGV